MPRHDDIFDFSPQALQRVQQARDEGVVHSYVGTEWPDVVHFFGLEVEPRLRGQGRARAWMQKVNEHCDATGFTRIAVVMSRSDMPLDKLLALYAEGGTEPVGEIMDADTDYPWVNVVRRPGSGRASR